ncbi:geranylgeranyl reductase family protein [Actinacidiphila acidipaludis]|uniref:Geranylgeranyl reductase family protein n=1 Tax=Actinacidiphila acidipaludis TaxID=2873382 RepID=A0ABS7QE71_9ACTN|nr:geranylgeranyl reductase family protein [Streptomyces acidipaludis]MBY8881471.1 geranylgeranyl reductase family protein [Streptomyces acidipaludis]
MGDVDDARDKNDSQHPKTPGHSREPDATPQPRAARPGDLTTAQDAQVIVVGAGPAGSSTAFHLARAGVDVLLLEKDEFPREKVCGDGLTPRAVHQLVRMGVDITGEGWHRSRGMRWVCGDRDVLIDWPVLARFPDFGLTRTRHDFDEILVRHAQAAGARLHTGVKVTAPLTDRAGRVVGVRAAAGPDGEPVVHRAPLVVAADGASARLAVSLGAHRDQNRPMATAVRRYYRSPLRSSEEYLELWADVRHPATGHRLPGYGWIFPMGDGRVNVGLGLLTRRHQRSADLRGSMNAWLAQTPPEWGLDDAGADGPVRSAALPMGLNRRPQYGRGLLLVGDSAGSISPWSGEGICQAMESGEAAAEVAALALTRPEGPGRERVLRGYPDELNRRWGRYYRLGNFAATYVLSRAGFAPLLNHYITGRPALIGGLARLLTNLTDEPSRDGIDHVLNTLVRLTPAPIGRRRR